MNITDIDDKIIRRARREHLFAQYRRQMRSQGDVVKDVTAAMEVGHFPNVSSFLCTFQDFREKSKNEVDPDKKAMLLNTLVG